MIGANLALRFLLELFGLAAVGYSGWQVAGGPLRWVAAILAPLALAAFWALVPGALSFESLSEAATGGSADITTLGTTVAAVFSIALGTLVSWSVLNTIASRRAGWADPDDLP